MVLALPGSDAAARQASFDSLEVWMRPRHRVLAAKAGPRAEDEGTQLIILKRNVRRMINNFTKVLVVSLFLL